MCFLYFAAYLIELVLYECCYVKLPVIGEVLKQIMYNIVVSLMH